MNDDTITKAELAEAWKRLHFDESFLPAFLADVEAHREPQYVAGAVYESPGSAHWRRTQDGTWEEFGVEGTFSHGFPIRPLVRLAPEGSRGAAEVLVGEWRRIGEQQENPEPPPFRDGYHAALRKCADDLEAALKGVI